MTTRASGGDVPITTIDDIDGAGVGEALDDNSGETSWWYDPASGQGELSVPDDYLLGGDDALGVPLGTSSDIVEM